MVCAKRYGVCTVVTFAGDGRGSGAVAVRSQLPKRLGPHDSLQVVIVVANRGAWAFQAPVKRGGK